MTPIRVLLADDHALVRAGVRSLLERLRDVAVIAEAADGSEALDLIGVQRPDVALLDINMPKLGGLEAAAHTARDFPTTRVIILSMHADEQYVRAAIRAGAAGYLVKDCGTSELETAIRAVVRGETYLSPAASTHLVAEFQRQERAEASAPDPLTPRQREVLRLIAEGLPTKAIARKLGISIKTVEAHRTQLMDRLDIHGIAGLVRYAIQTGLVAGGD
jgi:DNA-binding NarL/FixJ family response regulator